MGSDAADSYTQLVVETARAFKQSNKHAEVRRPAGGRVHKTGGGCGLAVYQTFRQSNKHAEVRHGRGGLPAAGQQGAPGGRGGEGGCGLAGLPGRAAAACVARPLAGLGLL